MNFKRFQLHRWKKSFSNSLSLGFCVQGNRIPCISKSDYFNHRQEMNLNLNLNLNFIDNNIYIYIITKLLAPATSKMTNRGGARVTHLLQ